MRFPIKLDESGLWIENTLVVFLVHDQCADHRERTLYIKSFGLINTIYHRSTSDLEVGLEIAGKHFSIYVDWA